MKRQIGLLAFAAMVLGACGGSASSPGVEIAEAPDAAGLVITDSPITTEVLDVATGAPTTLAAVAVGDRPVLLWFWAPH